MNCAGTYLIAVALTEGKIKIKDVNPKIIQLKQKFKKIEQKLLRQ